MSTRPSYANARSVDFDEIPVVDVSGLSDPLQFDRISAELVEAAETIGFFYLSGHGISRGLMDQAFDASKAFFALSQAEKGTVAVNAQQRGWMAQGLSNLEGSKTHDAKEVFFWGWDIGADHPDLQAGWPLVAENQWPKTDPDLRSELLPYYDAVVALSRKVLSALAVGLGQSPDFFAPRYRDPLARGQLVYYPPVTNKDIDEERFSAAEHSDFGVLTMLMQDMQGGLQVKNLSGDWIDAPPIPETFVCNIGDLLEHWTGGRLVSTKHRVINMSGNERYSIPIFCDPNSATVIDPADFGRPGADPITAGAYIVGKNQKNFAHYKS
jgi:isopenicillin N synthase-like dioxygenase